MRRNLRAPAVLLCFLALLSVASCQSADAERARTAPTTDEPRPALNPEPQHLVRVHGRLPRHMRLQLVTAYKTTAANPECQQQFSLGSFGGGIPVRFSEWLEVRHDGDRFEATLVVDKYLPGKCGWQYGSSNESVIKVGKPDDIGFSTMPVMDGERYGVDDSVPRCGPSHRNCTEERLWRLGNHDENIPVMLRCKTLPADETSSGGPYPAKFTCQDLLNDRYKKKHLIMPETRQVRIDVYDLDIDPDPAPLPNEANP